jgi:hypothetical protein
VVWLGSLLVWTVNTLDPEGIETRVVTIDLVIEDRPVAGVTVAVEGFGIEILRRCKRTL